MISVLENLENRSLFDLNHESLWEHDEVLRQFLWLHKYPWECLGSALVAFLESLSSRLTLISPHAVVESCVHMEGLVYLAPYATVRHGASLRGPVYVGAHAVVGHATECKGSVLLPYAKAAHFNYVGDSMMGGYSNLGAGTKFANLKFNHASVSIKIGEERIETHLKKLGAILGHHAQTGCNSVTNPGTILLPHAVLHPNQTGYGVIASARNPA